MNSNELKSIAIPSWNYGFPKRRVSLNSYGFIFCLLGILGLLPLVFGLFFFFKAGEFKLPSTVAEELSNFNKRYASGLSDKNLYFVKLESYKRIQPEIVALGSSRVLQFRGEDFDSPFMNMGLTANTIGQAEATFDEMIKIKKPKILIFGIDYWWFAPKYQERSNPEQIRIPNFYDALNTVKRLYKLRHQARLAYLSYAFDPERSRYIGLSAKRLRSGFDQYGSYHYTAMLSGAHATGHTPERFMEKVKRGANVKYENQKIKAESLEKFLAFLKRAEDLGIKLILFMPPMYPPMAIERERTQRSLVNEVPSRIEAAGFKIYNYHNTIKIGSDSCEYIDIWHGGEVTYLRLLERFYEDEAPLLDSYVKIAQVRSLIERNEGRAGVPRLNYDLRSEADNLRIGCVKPAGGAG